MRGNIRFIMYLLLITLISFLTAGCGNNDSAEESKGRRFRFGTLPVVQALPLFVASEKGFFSDEGIDVELVSFNSAMEKDVAVTSKELAGYFGDMMTPMVLFSNGTALKIIATNFNTGGRERTFAILAAPDQEKSIKELAKKGIACSSNTILDYLMTKMLKAENIGRENINIIEIKKIPLRYQMLVTAQVPAAMLPEPLVTLAEIRGAHVLVDDTKLELSATGLCFTEEFLQENGKAVASFLSAVNRAAAYINDDPSRVRAIMNKHCRMPEPLRKSFDVPAYPKLKVPSKALIMDVYSWLRENGIIEKELTYEEIVSNGNFF